MDTAMNQFRLYRRGNGIFYIENKQTRSQESLKTRDRDGAERLLNARNEAHLQPQINRNIAQAYLSACDPESTTRTWRHVMDALVATKNGSNKERYKTAVKDKAFDVIRELVLVETKPEDLLKCLLADGQKISTNYYLRRFHNFAFEMQWLLRPVLTKKTWPKIKHPKKRAITFDGYQKIIDREKNPERKLFYQLLWHLGGSQTDVACLRAENIDRENRVICYERAKLDEMDGQLPALISFGDEVAEILEQLPKEGLLFPYLASVDCKHRATEFKQRCSGLGIEGVTMHSFRYAWAERARRAGMPERYAAEALGHNSKAIHRAYAKGAQVKVPALENYEKLIAEGKLLNSITQSSKWRTKTRPRRRPRRSACNEACQAASLNGAAPLLGKGTSLTFFPPRRTASEALAMASRSSARSCTSLRKNVLTQFAGGLPRGFNIFCLMSLGMSCSSNPKSQAACCAVTRAGKFRRFKKCLWCSFIYKNAWRVRQETSS